MAYVITTEIQEGITDCAKCPFLAEGTTPDYDSCSKPEDSPGCLEVDYSTLKIVNKENNIF